MRLLRSIAAALALVVVAAAGLPADADVLTTTGRLVPLSRELIAFGTDTQAAGLSGLVVLQGTGTDVNGLTTVSVEQCPLIEMEIQNTAVTNNTATLEMYGFTPYDSDGNPLWGTSGAGIGSVPSGQAAGYRLTTIQAHQGIVISGWRYPGFTVTGCGSGAFCMTTAPLPVTTKVRLERFTTGAITTINTVWKLYCVGATGKY